MDRPPNRFITPEDWDALHRAWHPRRGERPLSEYRGVGINISPSRIAGELALVSLQPQRLAAISDVYSGKDEFRIRLDIQHFQPEEVSVKLRGDRLIVHAAHEERPDDPGDESVVCREFLRAYVLPKNVDTDSIVAAYNVSEGILKIRATKRPTPAPMERNIPIVVGTENATHDNVSSGPSQDKGKQSK